MQVREQQRQRAHQAQQRVSSPRALAAFVLMAVAFTAASAPTADGAPARSAACELQRYASLDLLQLENGLIAVPVRIQDSDAFIMGSMARRSAPRSSPRERCGSRSTACNCRPGPTNNAP
jgi:hypothetical protein